MEWQHNGSPRRAPKNSECKNPLENFSPRIYGIKMSFSSLIIFQRTKLSTLLVFAGAIERHFEGKTPRKITKGVWFLHDNTPAHRALAIQKKLAHWASGVLINHPILRICPCRTTTGSLD